MNCPRINRSGKPAGRLHSLFCAECRAAQCADDLLAYGIVQLRKPTDSRTALNRTLGALDLPSFEESYPLRRRRQVRKQIRRATATTLLVGVSSWLCYMDWNPGPAVNIPRQEESAGHAAFVRANEAIVDRVALSNTPAPITKGPRSASAIVPPMSINEALSKLDPTPAKSGPGVAIKPLEFDPALRSTPAAQTLQEFLHKNVQALEIVQANVNAPFELRFARTAQDQNDMRDVIMLQNLGNLLSADATCKAMQGDQAGALQAALNLVKFGGNVAGGGSLLSRLVGIKYQHRGQLLIWRMLAQMSAADARRAAREMEAVSQRRTSLRTTIQWEFVSGLAMRQDLLRHPLWRWNYASRYINLSPEMPFSDRAGATVGLYCSASNRQIMRNYTEYMYTVDQAFAPSARPYTPIGVDMPGDAVNRLMAPDFTNVRFRDTECEAQNALLTTALALHAYLLENQAYPKNLQMLLEKRQAGWKMVPGYLSRIPQDPFLPKQSLQYAPNRADIDYVTGLTYLLYSVGPDGTDQRGTPIDLNTSGSLRSYVFAESSGDIVAGINR